MKLSYVCTLLTPKRVRDRSTNDNNARFGIYTQSLIKGEKSRFKFEIFSLPRSEADSSRDFLFVCCCYPFSEASQILSVFLVYLTW